LRSKDNNDGIELGLSERICATTFNYDIAFITIAIELEHQKFSSLSATLR
jgi:hypothetical protein